MGAKRQLVEISDSEWEAIQAGAVSESKLKTILDHADIDKIRERAMPRNSNELSDAKKNLIATMRESGYTTEEIAKRVGVSTSTVNKYV